MRKVAVIAAVVFLAVTLLAVVLPRLVSLEFMKSRVVAVMEEKTGRKVAFSRLSLAVFPAIGVKITDLSVSGDPGHLGENFLAVPEMEVRMSIAPLLAGRAEFTKFILQRPEILFRRNRDGTHSATQIASRLAKVEDPARPRREDPVSVALKVVSIQDAKLNLILEEENGGETRWMIDPFTFRLSGIGERQNDFEVRTRVAGAVLGEIGFAGSAVREERAVTDPTLFSVSAKGEVFGQPMTVEGKMSAPLGVAEADLTVTFPKIALKEIPGIFVKPPAAVSRAALVGVASVAVKVSGNMQSMGFEAEADLTRAGWTVGPGLRKFIDMPCTVVAQGHAFPDLYLISNAELRFPPLLVLANASFVPSTGGREWAASSRITSLSEFAKSRGGGVAPWAPTGRLTASGSGKRSNASEKEAWNIALDLGDVGFQVPSQKLDLRDLNGHVDITPKTVEFQPLTGLFNGQHVDLRGTVTLGAVPTTGVISLRMHYLDADALFLPDADGEQGKKKAAAPAPGKARGPLSISARGNLQVDAGKIRGLEFRELAGTGRYEEGNLLLDSLRARLYGGEAKISGRVRLVSAKPDFRLKVVLKGVSVDEILSRKTSLKNFLSGAASLSADLGGGFGDFTEFTRTAEGSGSFRVTGGKIKGLDLLDKAAGLSGLRSLIPLAVAAPAAGTAAETPFSDLSADFRVSGGKIRSDALRIVSEKIGIDGAASLGFDRSFDFRGTLSLSGEMSERVRGAKGMFLTGDSGRVEIPLVMSGPVTSPAMALDTEALSGSLAGKVIRRLNERPAEGPPAPGTAPGKRPGVGEPGKALEDLIEKLLPGKR